MRDSEKPEAPPLCVAIPAFNEETAIYPVIRDLCAAYPEAEILVVDDGSTDGTAREVRRDPSVKLLTHSRNRGYGAALKTAIRHCRAPVIVWFDGDGQHPVEEIERLVEPVVRGEIEAHFGSRESGSDRVLTRVPGKWLLRWVAQLVVRRSIPDLNCGFRAFRTAILRRYLHLLPDGFSALATSTLLMIKRGYRVAFMPIHAGPRIGQSTVRWRDGLRTIALIVAHHADVRLVSLLYRPGPCADLAGERLLGLGGDDGRARRACAGSHDLHLRVHDLLDGHTFRPGQRDPPGAVRAALGAIGCGSA